MRIPSLLRFIQLSSDINYRGVKNIDAYFPQKELHRRRRIRLIKRTLCTSCESHLSRQMTRDIQIRANVMITVGIVPIVQINCREFFSDPDRILIAE